MQATPVAPTTEVWDKFSKSLRRFIATKAKNSDDVEDILQEVFIKIHLGLPQLRDASKLSAWLYQIARNQINEYYRKLYKQVQQVEAWETTVDVSSDEIAVEKQEMYCCFHPFLEELPIPYHEVLSLHLAENYTYEQIAEKLQVTISAVKSRVQRAKEMLKDRFVHCCGYHINTDGKLSGEQDCHTCHHEH